MAKHKGKLSKKLKILFVASEAAPFAKVGGLGEVIRSLPMALRALGHDARIIIPKYGTIDAEKYKLLPETSNIVVNPREKDPNGLLVSNIFKYNDETGKTVAYFLENQEYYEKRANVYGYADDTVRWVLLSRATLEFVRLSEWKPDIIVASDWQTGFVPNLMKTEYKNDPVISKIAAIFSIHNLKFQGLFNSRFVSEMDFDAGQSHIPDFFDPRILKMNGMRRGIMYADFINTVSPTYAKEILNEEMGEMLDKLLNERKTRLYGILNGIDVDIFNPKTDSDLAARYSIRNLNKRKENKLALQKKFDLPEDENKFVIANVGRLTKQKGLDLIVQIADSLLANIDLQFIIVGDGDNEFRTFFQEFQKKYPGRVAGHFFYDEYLPKMIFSGADAILIPSKFEPSGLVQMEAMRYGCIPIVRKVGGLADSVKNFEPEYKNGTGFIFEQYEPFALLIAIVRAHETYKFKKEWRNLIKRAMREDFSWKKSAEDYEKLFHLSLKKLRKKKK